MIHHQFELEQRILLTFDSLDQTFPYRNCVTYHWILSCFLKGTTLVICNLSTNASSYDTQFDTLGEKYFFSHNFTIFFDSLTTHVVPQKNTTGRKCAHYIMLFLCNNFTPLTEIEVSCQKLCWS